METLQDVHHQFASFFKSNVVQPYAYLLSRKLQEGHICLNLLDSQQEQDNLPSSLRSLGLQPEQLSDDPLVGIAHHDRKPFMMINNHLYLHRYYQYESIILEQIVKLINAEQPVFAERLSSLKQQAPYLHQLFNGDNLPGTANDQPDWQLVSAVSAVLNNFTIITGGPGTGKTTTVAKILMLLFRTNPHLKVALAAPTGKAAARMGESLKRAATNAGAELAVHFQSLQPVTIHRLLKIIPDTHHFRHHSKNPLKYDVVIIDESSMIDVALFAKLMDAVGEGTRVILLGDKNQLASVEAGSLFGDLCQQEVNTFDEKRTAVINEFIQTPARKITATHTVSAKYPLVQHIVELQHSHRFTGNQGIGILSKTILHNEEVLLKQFLNKEKLDEEVDLITTEGFDRLKIFVTGYKAYMEEPDIRLALQKLNKLRVLCAVREGEQGLFVINRRIEKILEGNGLIRIAGDFYEHKPVIITANNYDLGLFIGDIGIIRKDSQGVLKAWFEDTEGNLFSVAPGYITKSEPAYAMTIHKSQGSEFDQVFILVPASEQISLLTRELLYTAVTRARHKVYLQGNPDNILNACKRQIKRASGISQRFTTFAS